MKNALDLLIFNFLNNFRDMVGSKITTIRESKNISIEEVAERSGLNVSQITKIENDEILPSLSPLIKIARVLDVRISTFMDNKNNTGPIVTLRDEANIALNCSNCEDDERTSMNYLSLASRKSERHMEPFIIEIEPDSKGHKTSTHKGEEFIYVLSGTVVIEYGNEKFEMTEGDSIYYDSKIAHHVHALDAKAKILATVYVPK